MNKKTSDRHQQKSLRQHSPRGHHPEGGPALEHHQVLLKPRVTEKGMHQSEKLNQYTFVVNPYATKTQIKEAVETLFGVKVAKVATQTRKGKPRRYRFTYGRTKNWKKAIVTLHYESRIDFF